MEGNVDLKSDPWPSISPSAKDLVRKMLKQNVKERLTSQQVLSKNCNLAIEWGEIDSP